MGSLDSVRSERWRLVVDRETGFERLFDLDTDPAEMRDVASRHPQVARDLRLALDQQSARDRVVAARLSSGGAPVEVDDRTLRELQALGYESGEASAPLD